MLSGYWSGKLGDTVGAKWKDKKTLRTYSIPSNPNSPAQQVVKENFAHLSTMFMLIGEQLKPVSALNTKSMTLRNALLRLNKELVQEEPARLFWPLVKVSTGGLPQLQSLNSTMGASNLTVTWAPTSMSVISTRAKVVVLAIQDEGIPEPWLAVNSAIKAVPYVDGTMTVDLNANFNLSGFFAYILDYRGSTKVASQSVFAQP
jgi:hypothetical protein